MLHTESQPPPSIPTQKSKQIVWHRTILQTLNHPTPNTAGAKDSRQHPNLLCRPLMASDHRPLSRVPTSPPPPVLSSGRDVLTCSSPLPFAVRLRCSLLGICLRLKFFDATTRELLRAVGGRQVLQVIMQRELQRDGQQRWGGGNSKTKRQRLVVCVYPFLLPWGVGRCAVSTPGQGTSRISYCCLDFIRLRCPSLVQLSCSCLLYTHQHTQGSRS